MELLDRAAKKLGSYSAVGVYLGVTRSHISHLRHGRGQLQPIQAAKLAELIGERWTDHVLPTLAAMEDKPEDRAFWLGKVAALRAAAAVVLIAVAGLTGNLTKAEPAFS